MADGGNIIPIRDRQLRRVAMPHIGPNDQWALNNLPIARIASIILTSSEKRLAEIARDLDDDKGLAEETIDNFNRVSSHLMDIVEAIQAAKELTVAALTRIRS